MALRLIAVLIALSTGVTGILPTGDGYRCVLMNQRMAPGADCCPRCEAAPSTIGAPCCEAVAGVKREARAAQTVVEPRLQPAPLAAVLPLALAAAVDLGHTARNLGSRPRGQPPGAELHRLSQVLRV